MNIHAIITIDISAKKTAVQGRTFLLIKNQQIGILIAIIVIDWKIFLKDKEDGNMFDLTPFRKRKELAESLFNPDLVKDLFSGDLLSEMAMSIRADIKENNNEYIVEAELPGVNKDEIVVEFKEDVLTISAQKQKVIDEEKENYVRRERKRGKLSRSFYVQNIHSEGITADYKDGVLIIVLPKIKESPSDSHRIEIK